MYMTRIVSLAIFLTLTGCASTNRMSDEQVRLIKGFRSVAVASDVSLPEKPAVFGKKSAAGALIGGAIGIAAAQGISDEADEFKQFLDKNKIDIGNIVRQEVVTLLEQTKRTTSISEGGTLPKVQIVIEHYGVAPTAAFSLSLINRPLKAAMRVAVKVTSADGNMVWEGKDFITALGNPADAHTLDEYYADPQLLDGAFKQAAQIVIKEIFKDFPAPI